MAGVEAMLQVSGWAPWGLVVKRDYVWVSGGGPVWYVRNDLNEQVKTALGPNLDAWLVRTEPGQSDWLHEREWRVPFSLNGSAPGLDLMEGFLVAILVGDRSWEPPLVQSLEVSPYSGKPALAAMTPSLALVPRWFWNGTTIEELEPVKYRLEYLS